MPNLKRGSGFSQPCAAIRWRVVTVDSYTIWISVSLNMPVANERRYNFVSFGIIVRPHLCSGIKGGTDGWLDVP